MNICFFTEGNWQGKLNRSQAQKTDSAWQVALNASHCNIFGKPTQSYDLGIIIVPKRFVGHLDDVYNNVKKYCNKIALMQEADHANYQDNGVQFQIEYLHLLHSVDLIFCHNEIDVKYYKGLIPNKPVEILPTLMIEDVIPKLEHVERKNVMIGGTLCKWYSGIDSFVIAQEFNEEKIFAPSMGRKQDYEDYLEDITYLPYMNWSDWMVELNKMKYAVHLMRITAAGSFQLNCSRLKLPCIGYSRSDTQRILFPELTVDEGDLQQARKIAKHLSTNELFYKHCVEYAHKIYLEEYTEKTFIERFNQSVKNIA